MKYFMVVSKLLVVVMLLILATGCASTRVTNSAPSTQTQVDLTYANYKMIKAGAEGRSYGFRFLLGIIPITAPSTAAALRRFSHGPQLKLRKIISLRFPLLNFDAVPVDLLSC